MASGRIDGTTSAEASSGSVDCDVGSTRASILRNVYSINRGYQDFATRLNKLGAEIKPLEGI